MEHQELNLHRRHHFLMIHVLVFQNLHCDVANEEQASAVVSKAQTLGKLSGLINCAGIATAERTVGKSGPHVLAGFQRTININLIGSFNMIRLAAQAMSTNTPEETGERGVLISTASVAAYDGQIGQAAYSASKGGIVGMTLPIARDLSKLGIRNMTIAPGIFGTPMMFGMPQEVQDALAASVPWAARSWSAFCSGVQRASNTWTSSAELTTSGPAART